MSGFDLTWLLSDSEENQDQLDLLANYYKEVANGPMADYRRIIQGGNKQGQNYFVHVLDGINVLHKLRMAGVVEMDDLEEQLLFTAYTIHDINKIPPYGGRNVALSYINIATRENIKTELERIDLRRFFPEWEQYLEDIKRLMLLHQHDAAPLDDLNRRNHTYELRYERLLELGKLMYAIDNLDLSHTLSENDHKQNFLTTVNAVAERHWRWVTHCLGENRAFLSNLIHNTVVTYLKERHARDGHPIIADLLYYPNGVAYLLPDREVFTWSKDDNAQVTQRLAQLIASKKAESVEKLIKPGSPQGIRVSEAVLDSGASYTSIMYAIRKIVDRKSYSQSRHITYNQKLRPDIESAATHPDQSVSALARELLVKSESIVPLEQDLLKCGEMALAYRNLLHDHLQDELKKMYQCDAWTHIYTLLNLPKEKYALYKQINDCRRHYFIACDCTDSLDTIFERFLLDVLGIVEEQPEEHVSGDTFVEYLLANLEMQGTDYHRDFTSHLHRYSHAKHKQCCICSSSSSTVELMVSEVPLSMGVQVFSNRLKGGGREPKRNVCPICREQLILERLTQVSFNRKSTQKTKSGKKKNSEFYMRFYLHLYPYAFFTAPYLDALYSTLKNVVHEDNQCFFLKRDHYYRGWNEYFEQGLRARIVTYAQKTEEGDLKFATGPTKVNGISVPHFSEAVSNAPTLPLNAPGENYSQQFLFGLTHALMIADFFGCRVVLSRSPFPLLSNEYMTEHALNFFVDGVPLNLRWLLPTNEYRSIETYRDGKAENGGAAYIDCLSHWQNEQPDDQGYAAYENISRRLSILYQLAKQLNLSAEESEEFLLEVAMAMSDDPLAVYRVVDLTIEKQLRNANSKTSANKRGTKGKAPSVQNRSSEQMAIYLSKRVAPLLAQLVKE